MKFSRLHPNDCPNSSTLSEPSIFPFSQKSLLFEVLSCPQLCRPLYPSRQCSVYEANSRNSRNPTVTLPQDRDLFSISGPANYFVLCIEILLSFDDLKTLWSLKHFSNSH